ncbi:MAG: hypothetical protein C7B43_08080 [Sulfobacillus benefaciens]|uniref:Uncharacterized protein n=1 Tax=Sulfobacillus benefaciens TaxID=453960 RepID=A0A2T2X570_9FIRM|nr:MAG: hypothetical protein C7B43_08080 [Sulfobacillus benefaciens]HBQ96827.1 hypothetical protein [Sulfobacillus sp.]
MAKNGLGYYSAIQQAVASGLGLVIVLKFSIRLDLQTKQAAILGPEGFPRSQHWHILQSCERFLGGPGANFQSLVPKSPPALLKEKAEKVNPPLSSLHDQ